MFSGKENGRKKKEKMEWIEGGEREIEGNIDKKKELLTTLQPWRYRQRVPSKHQYPPTRL
jgi:hypothetical protein